MTTIEWTDETWNPVRGCSIVSKGCTNCYAMRQAHRQNRRGGAYEGLTVLSKGGPVWTGKVRPVPELLDWPLRKRKPSRIFVNSMSDLFHEEVSMDFIADVFAHMALANWHTYQVLTKRPARMLALLKTRAFEDRFAENYEAACDNAHRIFAGRGGASALDEKIPPLPLPHVWLGVSVEDQASADERIPLLLQTPSAVRWISAEPLLGPVELRAPHHWLRGINWVVVGGESGPGARPMHPEWARSLRDQCAAAGVPYFFKQWGAFRPYPDTAFGELVPARSNPQKWLDQHGQELFAIDRDGDFIVAGSPAEGAAVLELAGKKVAGRLLDGCTHDEYPA